MFKVRLLFCSMFFLSLVAKAQVLENYDGLWRSAQQESWIGSSNQLELQVDLESFPESELRIKLPAKSTVFVDGKLWQLTSRDTVFFQSVREIHDEFGANTVNFTVISPNLGSKNASVKKVLGRANLDEEVLSASGEPLVGRFVAQPVRDFYFSALFIILFFVALYKLAYPYLLAMMLQPLSVINAEDFSDSGNLQKFFSFDVIFYVLIVAMMLSQGVVTGLVVFRRAWLETWIGLDYSSLLLIWLVGAFGILLFTIVKFIGIRLLSYLFDLGKSEFSHFFYLLRLIVFGSSAVLLVGAYFVSNNFSGLDSALSIGFSTFFWFYILGVLGLFVIMMSKLSFKKYHLFTYLCIAELVPFLILAKWIMALGQ
jgi:hypothetical protein